MLVYFPLNPEVANDITNKIIEAAVAMVTYQFALGMQEVSGDGIGESLPEVSQEEKDGIIGERKPKSYGTPINLPYKKPQEERDSDWWIVWNGGGTLYWRM